MNLRSIDADALQLLHRELVSPHAAAAVDAGRLAAALTYPLMRAAAGDADIANLAAAHACGMLQQRPFAAGNQQAAFLTLGLFLSLNGWHLDAPADEATQAMQQLSGGALDEEGLANWIRQYL
jgi:death-on-curing protein